MFQTFEVTARPEQGPPRLAALRARLAAEGLDGFIVPRADVHQGEYVAPRDDRLAWLTGFTGSAGFAVVLADKAGVFVDGRYRVQVRAQVADVFTPVDWPEVQIADWLRDNLDKGVVGIDPWLHTLSQFRTLEKGLAGSGVTLARVDNPVDAIWDDQPSPPMAPVKMHPDTLAGKSSAQKRADLAKSLCEQGAKVAVITLPDSLCWLLNIRGGDIPRNPVAHGFALLCDDGSVDLFMAAAKLDGVSLGPEIRRHDPDAFKPALAALQGPVLVDPESVPLAVVDALSAEVSEARDPCILPKACKTGAEIAGAREAHLRDGAAMCEFLAWLDAEAPGDLTEIDVVTALEGFRRDTNQLLDISFETISGAGPNGAIVHYRVSEETNRKLAEGELLLVDSGGQYADGTTDITRTIAIGDPPREAAEAFTRVLQGMIAMSRARWPKGLAGRDLDALARMPLWLAGQDYGHGTGHGVGAYLCVHEGPQRLARTGVEPLLPGMILSNEPGFYREGAFGIRIENLLVVREAPALPGGTVDAMLEWETLTWVPIDRRLIKADMLSAAERDWLNAYHATCRQKIGPRLGKRAAMWLDAATADI
ncbi:aminopeptidase P family protein [Primorskyibacter aestuariivivens]|uniref:aminopeptidase P family protein n=1 Tax=Primorskyibacter aestuariivivens TaxID=1888912 RepID=UPI002301A364|nr:aminopeptidase P family protein [Primorskyibacter aestuariivivens]MDA7428658.1 aminopeptidase P family protein [Primorskyibacter aestuariivivens]